MGCAFSGHREQEARGGASALDCRAVRQRLCHRIRLHRNVRGRGNGFWVRVSFTDDGYSESLSSNATETLLVAQEEATESSTSEHPADRTSSTTAPPLATATWLWEATTTSRWAHIGEGTGGQLDALRCISMFRDPLRTLRRDPGNKYTSRTVAIMSAGQSLDCPDPRPMVLAVTRERKGFKAPATSHNQVSHIDLTCGWTDKTLLALPDELSKHTRVNSLGGEHLETSIVALTPLPEVLKFTRCRGASFVSVVITRVVVHHLRFEPLGSR